MTPANDHNHRTPPRATGLPLLGNAVDLLRDPLSLFARLYDEMGPVFVVTGPGRKYTVLAGPEANRFFMRQGDNVTANQPIYQTYIDDLGSERTLIAMDGEAHLDYRRAIRPGFSREMLSQHIGHLIEEVDRVALEWAPGEVVNVTQVMQFLVSQLMGLALAGCPLDDHFDDTTTFAHTFLGAGVGSFPDVMRHFPGYRRARSRFLGFIQEVLDWHRTEPSGADRSPDMIDLLLNLDAPTLGEADLLATAHVPYTNSMVYVGAMAGFMLYELLKNPDILQRVREEADHLFASDPPETRALHHTTWLHGALLETERMHPVALSIPRLVTQGFEFQGFYIPAGTITLTATAVTHYLPEFFPDPYTFDPTRFQPPRSEHRQIGALVPFGLGRHACLSAGIVEDVTMLIVARLLHVVEFDLEPTDYDLEISVAPFPAPARDFTVRALRQRTSEEQAASVQREMVHHISAALPDFDLSRLAGIASEVETRRFDAGTVIIRQDDQAEEFYILLKGRVEVSKTGARGEPQTIALLGEGQYFGEIGLLQGVPRTATVTALTAVETIVMDRQTFTAVVTDSDLTSAEIAEVVRRRVLSANLAVGLPQLGQEKIAAISPRFETLQYPPGETIIRQGDPPDRFYIIVHGQVEVVNHHPKGGDIQLAILRDGEYFGEIGLLQDRPRIATVRALTDGPVEVMALPREAFQQMLSGSDQASEALAMTMVERLIELMEHTENID